MYETNIPNLKLTYRGKVRDIYDLGEDLLIVTTDRISAFDVILPTPIPKKGFVLTQLTDFWLNQFRDLVPSHQSSVKLADVVKDKKILDEISGQAVIVKKAKPVMIECVVRGYILGSGYKDYQKTGEVCGIKLPTGLKMAEKLPEPIFTPPTKAEIGTHDANISFEQAANIVGKELATRVRDISLKIYTAAAKHAESRGIIIADTKFEFGLVGDKLIIIDEVLTPDSSRFWAAKEYKVGTSPVSYDKQIVRDYLETLDWNKKAPGPILPPDIIEKTSQKYQDVLQILTH